MNSYELSFDGRLLQRGFWIYVWEITTPGNKACYYIGRTGDSSSPNAASPFSRISSHLESKANAKGNSLYKGLRKKDFNPLKCNFRFAAYGPVFKEVKEKAMETHKPIRNKMAALEFALYNAFKKADHIIIGAHGSKHKVGDSDKDQFNRIIALVNDRFSLQLEGMK